MFARFLKEFLILTRPQNGLIVAFSYASGWLWASSTTSPLLLWTGMAYVYLLHAAGTIQNDVFDQKTDSINMPERPLVTGSISLYQAQLFVIALLVLAISLAIIGGESFVWWGILIYGIGWLYNEPPYLGSHKPLSSIVLLGVYFCLAPWLFGFFAAQGAITSAMLLALSGALLCRAATSLYKDFKDIKGDSKTGKKTFLLSFGPRPTVYFAFFFYLVGSVLLCSGTILHFGVHPSGIFFCLFLVYGIVLRFRGMAHSSLGEKLFPKIFTNELRAQMAYLVGLIWM